MRAYCTPLALFVANLIASINGIFWYFPLYLLIVAITLAIKTNRKKVTRKHTHALTSLSARESRSTITSTYFISIYTLDEMKNMKMLCHSVASRTHIMSGSALYFLLFFFFFDRFLFTFYIVTQQLLLTHFQRKEWRREKTRKVREIHGRKRHVKKLHSDSKPNDNSNKNNSKSINMNNDGGGDDDDDDRGPTKNKLTNATQRKMRLQSDKGRKREREREFVCSAH